MNDNAQNIVGAIEGNTFSGRDFIRAIMENYEHDYIDLLYEYHSFMTVHQLIGRYLNDHSQDLHIVCTNEREPSLSPFGNESSTMMWRRE